MPQALGPGGVRLAARQAERSRSDRPSAGIFCGSSRSSRRKRRALPRPKPNCRPISRISEAVDRLYAVANHVDDAIAGGDDIGATAAKFGLKKTVVAAVDEHGRGQDGKPVALPVAADRGAEARLCHRGGPHQPGHRNLRRRDFCAASRQDRAPFGAAAGRGKGQAIGGWQAEKRRDLVAKAATALAAAVGPGAKLAAVAAARGLKATTSPPFLRQSQEADGVPPALVAKLFAAKPGAVVTAADAAGSYVAQLTAVEGPPAAAKTATAGLSREMDAGPGAISATSSPAPCAPISRWQSSTTPSTGCSEPRADQW